VHHFCQQASFAMALELLEVQPDVPEALTKAWEAKDWKKVSEILQQEL